MYGTVHYDIAKMKFAVVTFLCLALAESSVIVPRRSLGAIFEKYSEENGAEFYADINKDVQDFLNLLPKAKIEGIIRKYVQNDAEVNSDWAYATSDAVKQQVFAIERSAEFKKVRAQLESGKLDVAHFVNMVHDIFGYAHITRHPRAASGLRGMLNEIKPTIPMTKIKLLAAKKYVLSSAFRKMVKIIMSKEFTANVEAVMNSALVVDLTDDARTNGVDVDAVYEFADGLLPIYKALKMDDDYEY